MTISFFLIKDRRRDEYLTYDGVNKLVYVIDPDTSTTLAYWLRFDKNNYKIFRYNAQVAYRESNIFTLKKWKFLAKESLRLFPDYITNIVQYVQSYVKDGYLIIYQQKLTKNEVKFVEKFYKSWIRVSIKRDWRYMFLNRCLGLSYFYYLIKNKEQALYYANLILNFCNAGMHKNIFDYRDPFEVKKRIDTGINYINDLFSKYKISRTLF